MITEISFLRIGLAHTDIAMRQLRTAKLLVDQTECRGSPSSLRLPPSQHQENGLSNNLYTCCDGQFTPSAATLRPSAPAAGAAAPPRAKRQPLYSADEKRRRDATPW